MHFRQDYIVFLIVLFYLHSSTADLKRCVEFEPRIYVDDFPHRIELERLFGSFNETSTVETDEIIQLLQSIKTDEIEGEFFLNSMKLIQSVVSLNTKNLM